MVALAVEDVGDQFLEAGVLDPGVEVAGPHPASVAVLEERADRPVVGDRVLARTDRADLVLPVLVTVVDPTQVELALTVDLLNRVEAVGVALPAVEHDAWQRVAIGVGDRAPDDHMIAGILVVEHRCAVRPLG